MSQHGTRSAYVLGCHCTLCTAANRLYQRQWYRDNYAKKPGEPRKTRSDKGSIRKVSHA